MTVNAAEQCEKNPEILGANYGFQQSQNDGKSEQHFAMNVWRTKNQVAHEYPNKGITELWQKLTNGEIRLVRYFDHDQRAIEYQPNEVSLTGADEYWLKMQHMINSTLLSKMHLIGTHGTGCDSVETYELVTENKHLTVEWLPKREFLKSLVSIAGGVKKQWNMLALIDNEQTIDQAFEKREHYQATDYADIGDNESDPFLQKMIAMGYISHGSSGFYDAEGHDIGSQHAHH